MSITGWYYLHANGELIYKRELDGTVVADIRESDFARALWSVDPSDREGAWRILVEGLAAGANLSCVQRLANKWKCNNEDAKIYADRVGVILKKDGEGRWCAAKGKPGMLSVAEGKGDTALEAMADLALKLGYKPSKMWGASFRDLLA